MENSIHRTEGDAIHLSDPFRMGFIVPPNEGNDIDIDPILNMDFPGVI
jgi:hypothetical protein